MKHTEEAPNKSLIKPKIHPIFQNKKISKKNLFSKKNPNSSNLFPNTFSKKFIRKPAK